MSSSVVAENIQMLIDAVARNASAVLSLPSAGIIHHHKTRFLGQDQGKVWIELPHVALLLAQELVSNEQPVIVSFQTRSRRLSFAAVLINLDPAYKLNNVPAIAVQVAFPTEIKGVQRRSAYRVQLTQDCDVTIKVWKIPNHAHINDRPPPSQEVKLGIRDISAGGLGIALDATSQTKHKLVSDQRLRVELRYKNVELLFDGRLRNVHHADGTSTATGIVFKQLEKDLEGRQKLAELSRIIGELSRDEVRRVRRAAS